jgi:uncharacterized protein (TIGR03437 family)
MSPRRHRLAATLAAIVASIVFPGTSTAADDDCLLPMHAVALTVQSSLIPSLPGQAVTLTAFVDPLSGTTDPTGTVQLMDALTDLGTFPLKVGQVSTTTVFNDAGAHSIYALYSGDSSHCSALTRFGQVVDRFTTSLALTSTAPTSTFGQAVVFTAQLGPTPPAGVAFPSGQVQFFDGSTALGAATPSSGKATLTVANLAVGSHQITGVDSGDFNWYSVRSAPVALTVNRAPTATVLAATSTLTKVTLTATVSAVPPGSGIPSGSLQFVDATTNVALGAATLLAGAATASLTVDTSQLAAAAGHPIAANYSGSANFAPSASNSIVIPALINAAGATSQNFAPDELVSLFGSNLANATVQAATVTLPPSLGGDTVSVTDSAGLSRFAGLYLVSPGQINFVIPSGTAPGAALITVTNSNAPAGAVIPIQINIASVAPGLFTASANGKGLAAAQIIRVNTDGTQTTENVSAAPINIGSDTLYLVLYGTGIRNRRPNGVVTCTISGQSLPVAYAGPQPQFPGLDQVDVLLPSSLKGAGQVNVTLTVDGEVSNTATLTFQ